MDRARRPHARHRALLDGSDGAVPRGASLSEDLKPSSAELLWIVDIYGFLLAGSLITMGTLGDHLGRRRLLLIGAAAFGVASMLAAFSTSPEMLIAARALLGVVGATLAPSTLSLIRVMFVVPEQRSVAIAIWITSFSVAREAFAQGLQVAALTSAVIAAAVAALTIGLLRQAQRPPRRSRSAGVTDRVPARLD